MPAGPQQLALDCRLVEVRQVVCLEKQNKTHECAVMIMSEVEEKTLFECDDFVIWWKVLRIHSTHTHTSLGIRAAGMSCVIKS